MTIALALTLVPVAPATVWTSSAHHQAVGPVLDRIDQARARTRECQAKLGLARSPVSSKPIHSLAYARWVLALWSARADAYCEISRTLYSRNARQLLERLAGPCLSEIIDRETAGTWNPQIYNYAGSGAYGLPQALPGDKMQSAGDDWRTNPLTQLKWMRSYVNARYGGDCEALAYHNRNGSY